MPSVSEILADLARAFPRPPVPDETKAVYKRELEDVPAAALEEACRRLTRTSEFFPTVRAIREAVAEQALQLPGEAAALQQVSARLAWARAALAEDAPQAEAPDVHPIVAEALEQVGGYHAFRAADEPGVVRGQFLRLYRDLRSRAVLDAQVGNLALPPAPARKRLGK